MSEKRSNSVKEKTGTVEKGRTDKVDKKESALLATKSPRGETHKRSSSYKETPEKGKPKEDASKVRAKVRYEDVMSPDDPLTMVKELILEQAAQIATDDELHVPPCPPLAAHHRIFS